MPNPSKSKILGVRLEERTLRDVKAEAARRGIAVNKLFEELWSSYRSPAKRAS